MLLCGNSQCSRQIRNKKTAKRGKDAGMSPRVTVAVSYQIAKVGG